MAGGGVLQVLGGTEAPAGGFGGGGGHHRHRAVLVGVATELAADAGKIAFQAAAAVAPQELEAPGEFLQGGAGFGLPAPLEGNGPFAERVLVVGAIQEAVDVGFVAVAVEPLGVGAHLVEVDGGASQQVAEGQLDVPVAGAGIEEAIAVQLALGDASNQLSHTDLAKLELRFSDQLPLALHHIGVAKHLLVNSADDLFLLGVVVTRNEFKRSFALLRETLDPEKRGRTEWHGQPDVFVTPWSFRSGGLERVLYKAQSNVSECCVT